MSFILTDDGRTIIYLPRFGFYSTHSTHSIYCERHVRNVRSSSEGGHRAIASSPKQRKGKTRGGDGTRIICHWVISCIRSISLFLSNNNKSHHERRMGPEDLLHGRRLRRWPHHGRDCQAVPQGTTYTRGKRHESGNCGGSHLHRAIRANKWKANWGTIRMGARTSGGCH